MSFVNHLAPKQNIIWSLRSKGLEPVKIAEKIGSSRQYVHQTLNTADAKLHDLLTNVAQANRIDIRQVDVSNGLLLGYHQGLDTNAIVSYSVEHGIQVWYWYEDPDSCQECQRRGDCRSYLLDEAEERDIDLTDDDKRLLPAELSRLIFRRLIPGLSDNGEIV